MQGKELLRQYNDLQLEIKELEARIQKIRNKPLKVKRDTVKGSNASFPFNERTYTIEGVETDNRENRISKLEGILHKRKAKCEEMKIEIEEFISTIPDSRTRRVFSLRYIDELSWLQIARRIERYDESYPRKVVHDKYLEGLE